MKEHYRQEGDNYWKKLPAEFEGAKLVVDLQGRTGPEPDSGLVADFEAFLLREGLPLKSRVHEPLKELAVQTGWFSTDELAASYFAWAEVVFLCAASELLAEWGAGPAFELQFSMESFGQACVDTYGIWVATFDKMALTGLRREQR